MPTRRARDLSVLNPGFRHVGVGVVRGWYKGYNVRVWTAHFGDLC